MGRKGRKCAVLFLSTLELSACTFGGGYVIVPLIRRKFVEKLRWIQEQEMLDIAAIAQSAPGAVAVNVSLLVGYRAAGLAGALAAVAGTVLPPLVILSAVAVCYQAVRDDPAVELVMRGILAGVAAIICDVVITMAREVLGEGNRLAWVLLPGAFAAVRFAGINIVAVLFTCGALGALDAVLRRKGETGAGK